MGKWMSGCLVLCGFVIAGAAVQAHHSLAGVYAMGKEANVHGTFKSFKIVNPRNFRSPLRATALFDSLTLS